MKQPEQSYTAIETAHGFVFFTDTTEGQKNRQDFLQFMADHYFDPHFNLGPVNVYRAEGVLKDGPYVNPGEGLYPEYAYLQMDKTPEMELVYRNEMKPTWEDFGSFCHNMHCTSSHRNRNIADILEEIESKDRKLLELSKQGTASDIRQQIEETGQDKALLDKLLKQYYDVRGHRTVGNILPRPDGMCHRRRCPALYPSPASIGGRARTLPAGRGKKQPVPCLCMDKRGFHPDRIF